MDQVNAIVSEAHLSSLKSSAAWAPRWKMIATACLVLENLIVLLGLMFVFGKNYLGWEEVSVAAATPTYESSGLAGNFTVTYPGAGVSIETSLIDSGDAPYYIGGAIILFSRLIHVIGLVAGSQAAAHSTAVSPSRFFEVTAE